ncbi:SAF domain-containing protein [Streptomyces acidiscabies]|uniref:SAF domain-containing protein n=1 Tax=Streptomyces acidiscabies TaxID=42234 RepID=UPI0038F7E54F
MPSARGTGPEARPLAFTGGARRRPAWVWGGIATVLVSAVGFTVIAAELGGRTDVLVLARDVPAGHVLGVRDVRAVKVAAEEGVVPLADREHVLGRQAKVPLVAGSFLSAKQVGERSDFPPAGRSQVSLGVEAGGAPPDLARGERVAVLNGPSTAGTSVGGADSAAVVGTVTGVQAPESVGGLRVVTVLVETAAARRAASFEHPRVVVLPAEGREAP